MLVLYIVLALVVVILILAVLAPKNYDVSRSIEINRSKSEVFEYLKFLKNQDEWSPWSKRDPNMVKDFSGTDGEVGAINRWKGNKEVGEGEQEITHIEEGSRIDSELRFLKPFKSTSDAYITTKEVDKDMTKVVWGFSGENKFPMSIMMLFMNMDKAIGKDFEEGLNSLKQILENQ
ncbi:MAG: SRPBCC family protein [Bacteroidota bacterium]|uniref:SRPBCC family protein n=1 Tax=Flagellimonas okinawensis TaxID=3031324 RepID=A0ABT5XJH4_9FLAO|nr:SRPBCC family protein [[Muricauda] okinawensis]MDF0706033.1 SRPBCC family protein [[Muricauda] okinawensis]MEC8830796.1 SRPBCC family protein [Bacteroidota bacterium]